MSNAPIPGIRELWAETTGDPRVKIAVLDGPVDFSHPSFKGARLVRIPGLVPDGDSSGRMTSHGTHVASIIFGQHDGPVCGIAPGCTGLVLPVFSDGGKRLTQIDLSRAIERAVEAGANVINVSGGQLSQTGDAEYWLERAVKFCEDNNVLLVASAGNDGCDCLHVPAAISSVLAVGALGADGRPLDFSNWGKPYGGNGILAPGQGILGAVPGGATERKSGTSFATPIVSGVAGLLLSRELKQGRGIDPQSVRTALLNGVSPCDTSNLGDCSRFLAGSLDVSGAMASLAINRLKATSKENPMSDHVGAVLSDEAVTESCACQRDSGTNEGRNGNGMSPSLPVRNVAESGPEAVPTPIRAAENHVSSPPPQPISPSTRAPVVTASEATGLAYVIGELGFDFGTEARRDSFKQLMPPADGLPANPHDARQLVEYLKANRSESRSIIWTLNSELTPLYAVEATGPYGGDVNEHLVKALEGQIQAEGNPDFVERVSVPGILTNRTVRLFSGQHVPVIVIENTRGLYYWKINALLDEAWQVFQTMKQQGIIQFVEGEPEPTEIQLRFALRGIINRIYFDFRNLGTTSPDRALNYAATNIVQLTAAIAPRIAKQQELASIQVVKSPSCRPDSDCWDVKLLFFNPRNVLEGRQVVRFTVDVADTIPVTLGRIREWTQPV